MAQTKLITPQKVDTLRYPLPESWRQAVGILRDRKRKELERHVIKLRKEWSRGLKK